MMRPRFIPILACALVALGPAVPRALAQDAALTFGLSGNPDTLDPQKTSGTLTFQVLKSVYDTLVEPDETGRIVPALADSWKVSADSLTWTFRLRKDVRFHNGDALTADDVKSTFDRIRDKATASPKAADFAGLTDVDVVDDSTVAFRLSEPSAPFLATLASGWSAILPHRLIASDHDFGSRPVGTGPFVFKEWIRDGAIRLEKNPAYWLAGLPTLDSVRFQIVTEPAVKLQGLITGRLQVADILDPADLPLVEKNPALKVQRNLSSMVMVVSMNCSRPSLSDLRVRQAISMAIDKKAVMDVAYGGGEVVGTFMDSGSPFYADFTGLLPYDPGRARRLLAEAGVSNKLELSMILPQNYDLHVKAGQIVQAMLAKVGITANIRLVEWATWLSDVYKGGKFDLTVIGHTGKLDPDGRLAGYGTDKTYVRWVSPRTADLIASARITTNTEARKKLYGDALEIMAREVPMAFLGTSYNSLAMRAEVKGLRMTYSLDTFDLRRLTIQK